MSAFIKFTNGPNAAYGVGAITFPDNAVMIDPRPWNSTIAQSGGMHLTTLEHAETLARGYTDVRDVRIPEGEFRVTLGKDRMKAHSLWMSAPRPIADLLKPFTPEQRRVMLYTYPSLLNIPGVAEQVLRDCPADKRIGLLRAHTEIRKHAATETIARECPATDLAEFMRIVPGATKFIQNFANLPVATLVALVRAGNAVHTAPITEAFRRAEAPSIETAVGPWTMWSNGLSTVKTAEGYIGTWMRAQHVLGGLAADERCVGCDHCPSARSGGCWCGSCRKDTPERADTHRRVHAFKQHDVVMFDRIVDGLPEGAFECRSGASISRGQLVAGVPHGRVEVTGGTTAAREYEFGVAVPVKEVKEKEAKSPRKVLEMDPEEAKESVERTTAAVLERLTPPPVALQNAFSALMEE
jgi:hypothetical protein